MIEPPHIGNMLNAYVKEKRIFKAGWAKQMGIGASGVEGFVKNPNAKIDTLFKICQVLNYNFFEQIAALLNHLPPSNTPIPNADFEALQKENETLKIQVATLKEAIGLMGKTNSK